MTERDKNRLFEVLLTAEEAYPALEAEFLRADQEVVAGFRIFDPFTKLRSEKARAIGDTWFDMITHTLNRGVKISLILSDFDPVARPELHAYAWECVRGLIAAGEASEKPDLMSARASMHPARVGLLPRLVLWPKIHKEIRSGLAQINTKTVTDRRRYFARAPRLQDLSKWRNDVLVPRLTLPPLVPVTHHQKLAAFDRKRLYVGGLDLNERRYDTPNHMRAASDTWHDTQVLLEGTVAAEAADHLKSFEATTCGKPPISVNHLLRTISAKRKFALPFLSPKTVVSELAEAHGNQIKNARHLVYLETQYFRDTRMARQLAERAQENRGLSLILILPAAPEDAAFVDEPTSDVAYGEYLQTKALAIVNNAFGKRVFIGSPAQPRAVEPDGRATHFGAPIIYLHAKVSVFDQTSAIISSANLNGRSMAWDTEAGIITRRDEDVRLLKSRCFNHWLGPDCGDEFHDPATAQRAWAKRALENAHRSPRDRQGFILPYDAAPAEKLGYNLPGVPEEMA